MFIGADLRRFCRTCGSCCTSAGRTTTRSGRRSRRSSPHWRPPLKRSGPASRSAAPRSRRRVAAFNEHSGRILARSCAREAFFAYAHRALCRRAPQQGSGAAEGLLGVLALPLAQQGRSEPPVPARPESASAPVCGSLRCGYIAQQGQGVACRSLRGLARACARMRRPVREGACCVLCLLCCELHPAWSHWTHMHVCRHKGMRVRHQGPGMRSLMIWVVFLG